MASADPITEFLNAVERAKAHQVDTAPVVLATADEKGRPSARLVLLRGADTRGFVFFTNYNSRKGRELTGNPHAALCFYWSSLDEQIRIEGRVERVSSDESDAYFDGPAAWQPVGRVGLRPEPGAHLARNARREVSRDRASLRGPVGSTAAVLGRFPPHSFPHRILVRTSGSPARPRPLRARREQLAHRTSQSLTHTA